MNIVFGIDLSDESVKAAQWADALKQATGGSLKGLYVVEKEYAELGGSLLDNEDNRLKLEDQIEETLGDLKCAVKIEEGEVLEALIEEGESADALVLGASPDSAAAWMMRSVPERVCHRTPTTTIVVHPDKPLVSGSEWVVGVDFSEHSLNAANAAIKLAKVTGAKLHFVHIVPSPYPTVVGTAQVVPIETDSRFVQTAVSTAKERMEKFIAGLNLQGVEHSVEVTPGYPIISLSEVLHDRDASAVVLGCTGRSRLGDFLMGSVTTGIVKRMPTTVIVVP